MIWEPGRLAYQRPGRLAEPHLREDSWTREVVIAEAVASPDQF